MTRKPGTTGLPVPGIHTEEEALLPQSVQDRVIDRAPVLATEQRVLRAPHPQFRCVVGRKSKTESEGTGAANLELAHVRHVKKTGSLADRRVLLQEPPVLHGHLPAAELREARTGHPVSFV